MALLIVLNALRAFEAAARHWMPEAPFHHSFMGDESQDQARQL